uniref:Secreted protein n=1 Tax=Physcomitrium patens TaxID=3218 RepID=A0A7I4AJD3_PHYPA
MVNVCFVLFCFSWVYIHRWTHIHTRMLCYEPNSLVAWSASQNTGQVRADFLSQLPPPGNIPDRNRPNHHCCGISEGGRDVSCGGGAHHYASLASKDAGHFSFVGLQCNYCS